MDTSTLRRALTAGALAAALPAAAAAQEPTLVPCQETYTVTSGETLTGVAARCDVTVWALIRVNPGLNSDGRLRAGQELRIPQGRGVTDAAPSPATRETGARPALVHVVRAGQTLGEISGLYGTPVPEILAANDIPDPNVLRVGKELRIPPPARRAVDATPAAEPPAVPSQSTARPHGGAPPAVEGAPSDPEATAAATVEPALAAENAAADAAEPASVVAPRVMVGHPETGTGPLQVNASGLPAGSTARVSLGPEGGTARVVQTATVDARGRLEVQVALPGWVDRTLRHVVVVEVPGEDARVVSRPFRLDGGRER